MLSRWLTLILFAGSAVPKCAADIALEPWQPRTVADRSGALLQNEMIALRFPASNGGFGRCEIWMACTPPRLMGVVTPISRLLYLSDKNGEQRIDIVPTTCTPVTEEKGDQRALRFSRNFVDVDGVAWQFSAVFALPARSSRCEVRYTLSAREGRRIIQFRGPSLFAGESSFGAAKDEAIFPGLEYLIAGERSSSRLDVTSRERKRFAPHPYKVTVPVMAVLQEGGLVGLLWDPRQKWDGKWECPQPIFSSPNWLEGKQNHLMMLSVPSFPWHEEYAAKAATPYPLKTGQAITIECRIFARPAKHVTEAVGEWLNAFGYPRLPEKPRPLENEVDFSLRPYLSHLWQEKDGKFGWIPWTGGSPTLSGEICTALSIGTEVAEDKKFAAELQARIDHARRKAKLDATGSSIPYGYRFGSADKSVAAARTEAEQLMRSQKPDGSWVFDPPKGKMVLGIPVETLGERGDTAAGLVAAPTLKLLKYALITGDGRAAGAAIHGLEFLSRLVRPQGAQTWECPLHAPDTLAAAEAADACLHGYLLTGDSRYLDRAKYWARTGLPFIYMWNAADREVMRYCSMPIFGASIFTWPWFGRPVQWTGLAYADVIRRLAPYDKDLDWLTIAKGITFCAMQQQAKEGDKAGLFPDSWNLVEGSPAGPWLQPGRFLLSNVLGLLGREIEPVTIILHLRNGRVHISTLGKVEASLNEKARVLWIRVSGTEHAPVISVAGLARPAAVTWGDTKLTSSAGLRPGTWTYQNGILFATAPKPGPAGFRVIYKSLGYSLPPREMGWALSVSMRPISAMAGRSARCSVKLRNRFEKPITGIEASLEIPPGWILNGPASINLRRLEGGRSREFSFTLVPPYSEAGERHWVGVKAEYSYAGRKETAQGGAAAKVGTPITARVFTAETRGLELSETVELHNQTADTISGTAEIAAPPGWNITPPITSFSLAPSAKQTIRFNAAAPQGTRPARYITRLNLAVGNEYMPEIESILEIPAFCTRIKSPVRIDGSLLDWQGFPQLSITEAVKGEDRVKGPDDLSATARLAWSDKMFYVAVEVTDNKFMQSRSGPEISSQDSVQLGFDTARDANTGGFEDDDYEYGFALTKTEVLCWRWHGPPDKPAGRAKEVEIAIVRTGTKTAYEIGIPWSALLPFVPEPGRSFGLSILVNDDDGSGRKGLQWGGGLFMQKQPVKFIGVRLKP